MDKITIERETLLPCPFCGAEPEIITLEGETDDPSIGAQCVQCTSSACGAASGLIYPLMDDVRHLLRERWNRRAALAAQPPRVVTCTMTDAPCTRNCGLACSLQMEALAAQPAPAAVPPGYALVPIDELANLRRRVNQQLASTQSAQSDWGPSYRDDPDPEFAEQAENEVA